MKKIFFVVESKGSWFQNSCLSCLVQCSDSPCISLFQQCECIPEVCILVIHPDNEVRNIIYTLPMFTISVCDTNFYLCHRNMYCESVCSCCVPHCITGYIMTFHP